MLKKWFVLLMVLALFAGGCSSDSDSKGQDPSKPTGPSIGDYDFETEFTPETLGLTPGATATEINLNWYSDEITDPDEDAVKVLFWDGANDFKEVTGKVSAASAGKSAHKAAVTGLKADTEYSYWVSNDGESWSEEYKYRTPKTASFRFASIGDPQLTLGNQDSTSELSSADGTTAAGWLETMEKVGLADVNFVAGVGDQVDVTSNGNEDEYRNFFAPSELRSIPWAPAVGNHDRHYPFQYHYNIPNEQTFTKLQGADYSNNNDQYAEIEAAGNYWYRYNNALFVVLNTSAYPTSKAAAEPIIKRFDDTLKAAKNGSPGYTWLFVQHHKSTASVADHIADRDIQYYVEAGFEELMTTHGVDFVLAGHDHVYARSFPLTGKKDGTPSVPDTAQGGDAIANPNGTIYVTMTTGSGLKYYDLFNQSGNLYVKNNAAYPYLEGGAKGSVAYAGSNILNWNNAAAAAAAGVVDAITDPALWTKEIGVLPASNAVRFQDKKPAFTVVDVEGNKVTFNTYNIDDTVKSIDTFTVTK